MFKLLVGDAIEQLKTLPDKSINTCVTSPPYYGLRDYGVSGQLGLEESPEEYINRLVEVFREVKRVLRDDGVLWVNIGDTYNGAKKGNTEIYKHKTCSDANQNFKKKLWNGAKPKDLIGIPWMLAFALRADGWYLRQDIIWAKNNPMPEPVKDRCTRSHEYIFMLTKKRKYWFDHEAMQEPVVTHSEGEKKQPRFGGSKYGDSDDPKFQCYSGNEYKPTRMRNKRDVWRESVAMTKEAHFAVFPKKLIEPCILAGCPEGGWVLDPFSGSGTSGIVAVNNNRNFIGIELNPEYVNITKRRVEKECTSASIVVQCQ